MRILKSQDSSDDVEEEAAKEEEDDDSDEETWKPSMEGFVKYLVDSQFVFDPIERIVDQSDDVAYAYFRNTGLERAGGISKDLEWFSRQGIVIPEPSTLGVSYAKYLEEITERSAPLFLSHLYNIYFSHIAGGQVIAKQVSEKILVGRELELYKRDGEADELLKEMMDGCSRFCSPAAIIFQLWSSSGPARHKWSGWPTPQTLRTIHNQ
ncbi:hypothetical protein Ddye_010719 [Dipteronia dyeriana]|uniref:Inactive heme oxygenase 2, chloroplastic n=1 Tax=Dipteronia dyeriana TaxID=168575 RepID=A0AAD9XE83_9ROSI|nr:hypothetical protein Ddye_010719 [Dipteronia dyeriana]